MYLYKYRYYLENTPRYLTFKNFLEVVKTDLVNYT